MLGIVIWWIKDSIIGKKLAWLKLWAIFVILGIFNTYGPAHCSIQGLIYLAPIEDIPASASLGILETMAQPLLFSIVVTFQRKNKLGINTPFRQLFPSSIKSLIYCGVNAS